MNRCNTHAKGPLPPDDTVCFTGALIEDSWHPSWTVEAYGACDIVPLPDPSPSTRMMRTFPDDKEIVDQEAIPWCTTHDSIAERTRGGHWLDECGDDPFYCKISTGGPDHKWWKDT